MSDRHEPLSFRLREEAERKLKEVESQLTAFQAKINQLEQLLEESQSNEAGLLSRWEEALTAPFPAEGVMREPAESLYRRTELLRARVKELEKTVHAREELICETVKEKGALEASAETINNCLKLALGNEWNRANPIIVPYLIKRERDEAYQRIATLEQALRETTKVGVCVVIRNEFDQVLLGLKGRACSSEFLNKWVIPGGRLNYKEGIESGIRREIREETGIEIRISRFLPPQEVIHESGHFVFVVCEAWHASGECVGNDDLTEVKWFDHDCLPHNMTPITQAALAAISTALNEKGQMD